MTLSLFQTGGGSHSHILPRCPSHRHRRVLFSNHRGHGGLLRHAQVQSAPTVLVFWQSDGDILRGAGQRRMDVR